MRAIYGFFDKVVEIIKSRLTVDRFKALEERSAESTDKMGLTSLIIIILSAVVLYFKFESDEILQFAGMAVIAMTIFGYVSQKFLDGCQNISENNHLKVSIGAYSDLGGLAFGTMTLLAVGSAILAIVNEQFEPGVMMLGMAILLYMTTFLIINPTLIGLKVDKSTSLAQEAISLLLVPMKVVLRSMKVITSWMLTLGNFAIMGGAAFAFAQTESYEAFQYIAIVTMGYSTVGAAMVLPLAGYFGYMLISLLVDAIRNVLMIGEINNLLHAHPDVGGQIADEDGVESADSAVVGFDSADGEEGELQTVG